MILEVTTYGNPVLRSKGRPVPEIDDKIRELAHDMLETMRAHDGLGLAAQQVGLDLRLFVLDVPQMEHRPSRMWREGREVDPADHMPMVVINPELELSGEPETESEGCLSFPELSADIRRPTHVHAKVTLLDGATLEFEAEGLLARALQHENDHLNGILFIDRMSAASKAALAGQLKRLQKQNRR